MFGAMYQTGYAGLRSCGMTQSVSKRSHPLQSEVSLTGLSAAKSFLNELLLRSPGSLAWLPSGVTTRGTITGFLPNRKGSTRLRISGCPSNSSIHGQKSSLQHSAQQRVPLDRVCQWCKMELQQRHECENIRKKLSEHLPFGRLYVRVGRDRSAFYV